MGDGLEQVTADTKEILGQSAHREESLCLSRGLEPSHGALPLSDGLVRDFRPVVCILAVVVNDTGPNDAGCGGMVLLRLSVTSHGGSLPSPFGYR